MAISVHENIFRFKIPMHDPALVKMWNSRNYLSSINPCLILTTQDTPKAKIKQVNIHSYNVIRNLEFQKELQKIPEDSLPVQMKKEMPPINKIQNQVKLSLGLQCHPQNNNYNILHPCKFIRILHKCKGTKKNLKPIFGPFIMLSQIFYT